MSEKLVDRIAASIGRRGFLGTLSGASAAFIVGFFRIQGASAGVGLPPDCPSDTFTVGCCCLFFDPRSCSFSNCGCEWVWICYSSTSAPETIDPSSSKDQPEDERNILGDPEACRRYSCKECYIAPNPPQQCTGEAKCSKATFTTVPCG